MKAIENAEKALREAHLKHRDLFINPLQWRDPETSKPWAIFVQESDKLMVRTFERRDEARDFAKTVKEKAGLTAEVSAPHRTNAPRTQKRLGEVNTLNLFFSKAAPEKKVAKAPKKHESVKRQTLSLSL